MKLRAQVSWLAVVFCVLPLSPALTHAQGTLHWTVTFDDSPYIARGDNTGIAQYIEQDMWFRAIGPIPSTPPYFLGRAGGGVSFLPENGTAYLLAAFSGSLAVSAQSGQRFGVVSVDLAEFSTLYNFPRTVPFIGYRSDGSIVTTAFTTDGVIDGTGPLADFQTFQFDSRFADLVRLEVPTDTWALDNMVFSQVPEPAAGAILVVGGLVLGALRWCKPAPGSRRKAAREGPSSGDSHRP
jgi:hypothetical protein